MLRKSNKKASSRLQINIKGVKDDILMLSDRQYRIVLEVSPINFELKSEEEKDTIIDTFQNFLDSLDFSVQFIMRTRELDIDKYIESFQEMKAQEKKDVYKQQIESYTQFVKSMIKNKKILARRFYIIIPFTLKDVKDFDSAKEQLSLRRDIVSKGLIPVGTHVRPLSGLETLDLFYSFYSPRLAKTQPITSKTAAIINESFL